MTAPAEIDASTLRRLLADGEALLVDVREPEEFADERIPGAQLVPLASFDPRKIAEAAGRRAVVLYCLAGRRSAQAAASLAPHHDRVLILRGGINVWTGAGLPTEGGTPR